MRSPSSGGNESGLVSVTRHAHRRHAGVLDWLRHRRRGNQGGSRRLTIAALGTAVTARTAADVPHAELSVLAGSSLMRYRPTPRSGPCAGYPTAYRALIKWRGGVTAVVDEMPTRGSTKRDRSVRSSFGKSSSRATRGCVATAGEMAGCTVAVASCTAAAIATPSTSKPTKATGLSFMPHFSTGVCALVTGLEPTRRRRGQAAAFRESRKRWRRVLCESIGIDASAVRDERGRHGGLVTRGHETALVIGSCIMRRRISS